MKPIYRYIMLLIFIPYVVTAQTPDTDMVVHDMDMTKSIMINRGVVAGQAMSAPIEITGRPSTISLVSAGSTLGRLFPPEAIMRNRDNLNLTARQVTMIKDEMKTFQSGIVDVQWDLNEAQSNLDKELNNEKIDVDRALSLVDDVMQAENALKKSHLTLLIKIRNVLDAKQLAELEKTTGFQMGHLNMAIPTAPHSFMRWQQAQ
jgi:hypothetical protein